MDDMELLKVCERLRRGAQDDDLIRFCDELLGRIVSKTLRPRVRNRKEYHRNYMREYMRKRRVKEKDPYGFGGER